MKLSEYNEVALAILKRYFIFSLDLENLWPALRFLSKIADVGRLIKMGSYGRIVLPFSFNEYSLQVKHELFHKMHNNDFSNR